MDQIRCSFVVPSVQSVRGATLEAKGRAGTAYALLYDAQIYRFQSLFTLSRSLMVRPQQAVCACRVPPVRKGNRRDRKENGQMEIRISRFVQGMYFCRRDLIPAPEL